MWLEGLLVSPQRFNLRLMSTIKKKRCSTPNTLKPFQSLALCKSCSVSTDFKTISSHSVWVCINFIPFANVSHVKAAFSIRLEMSNFGVVRHQTATISYWPTPRAQFAQLLSFHAIMFDHFDHFVLFCHVDLARPGWQGGHRDQKQCRQHRGRCRFTSFSLAESSRPWRHPCLGSIWVGSQWIHLSMQNWTVGDTIAFVNPSHLSPVCTIESAAHYIWVIHGWQSRKPLFVLDFGTLMI